MQAWNIKQLNDSLNVSLTQCNTPFEVSMCKAIGGKEIREKAIEWAKERKLTPGEISIAEGFGYKG